MNKFNVRYLLWYTGHRLGRVDLVMEMMLTVEVHQRERLQRIDQYFGIAGRIHI